MNTKTKMMIVVIIDNCRRVRGLNDFGTLGNKYRGVLWSQPISSSDSIGPNKFDYCFAKNDVVVPAPPLHQLQSLLEGIYILYRSKNQGRGDFVQHMTKCPFEC
jgi:hypothetical protein